MLSVNAQLNTSYLIKCYSHADKHLHATHAQTPTQRCQSTTVANHLPVYPVNPPTPIYSTAHQSVKILPQNPADHQQTV